MAVYKIFCDESCHLEHDGADIMVLGAIHCSEDKAVRLTKHIKWLRHQHSYHTELKWTKLIAKQWPFYRSLIDLLIDDSDVLFKATVVQHKKSLDHQTYNSGSHNTFYYKMFYYTLRDFLHPENTYKIYLDYMDTLGGSKAQELCRILQAETHYQLNATAYIIQSYEAQLIQLCDFIIGAVSYKNRTEIEHNSEIKNKIVAYIETKLNRELNYGTPPWERNFNIFRFAPVRSLQGE
ncbi:DUF3800 domain-containing protein [Parashewanella curva]|uniref:DUF3800 domain-containing protein n=1 Tax=Parashewanella curva TaxID=2338552 RepID=A0A3L8PZC4_9GAMM|nr:DUF3800 domain-containing protein [Parashewanella curva]RLV60500.1 DUF3800 domain-containing protein [Parashewanella curva]